MGFALSSNVRFTLTAIFLHMVAFEKISAGSSLSFDDELLRETSP